MVQAQSTAGRARHPGPLAGLKVVEIASLGPGPFSAMLLSDMGADIVRVDRAEAVDYAGPEGPLSIPPEGIPLYRGRRSLAVDLKNPDGVAAVMRLATQADVLLEGYRPGVMEKLGLGPTPCLAANPRLIYGRVSGYGQDGPLAHSPGHDINYIALSGVLAMIGADPDGAPVIPLSLAGDFGGAGMALTVGVLCALYERERSGQGQVVDCSMVESASYIATLFYGMLHTGHHLPRRGSNMVDGGAHFYNVYPTSDGQWVAVAAVLPKFYANFLKALGLDQQPLPDQLDAAQWPAMKARITEIFRAQPLTYWNERLLNADQCYSPVIGPLEASSQPQARARESFVNVAGVDQPAPAPKLSRTPGWVKGPGQAPGMQSRELLADWGFGADEIERLHTAGAVRTARGTD
ncbi:CaiB/BaiF CoA transferase family protein [Immundisolibacter sp.]|uniref:CaiB/BaiF CoA transferase family protein n=1 Tax=Immundisolibacter sp. TaxID=1934948 RepID=UPI0035644570